MLLSTQLPSLGEVMFLNQWGKNPFPHYRLHLHQGVMLAQQWCYSYAAGVPVAQTWPKREGQLAGTTDHVACQDRLSLRERKAAYFIQTRCGSSLDQIQMVYQNVPGCFMSLEWHEIKVGVCPLKVKAGGIGGKRGNLVVGWKNTLLQHSNQRHLKGIVSYCQGSSRLV